MGTVVYQCGCSFSHSMFGKRELCGMTLCLYHTHHPDVLRARVCDVQEVIQKLIEAEGYPEYAHTGVA